MAAPSLLDALRPDVLALANGLTCALCRALLSAPLLRHCTQAFHRPCIEAHIRAHKQCPCCLSKTSRRDLVEDPQLECIVASAGRLVTAVEGREPTAQGPPLALESTPGGSVSAQKRDRVTAGGAGPSSKKKGSKRAGPADVALPPALVLGAEVDEGIVLEAIEARREGGGNGHAATAPPSEMLAAAAAAAPATRRPSRSAVKRPRATPEPLPEAPSASRSKRERSVPAGPAAAHGTPVPMAAERDRGGQAAGASTSAGSKWARGVVVALSGIGAQKGRAQLASLIEGAGGKVVDSWPSPGEPAVTHVVCAMDAKRRAVQRSLKFCLGVAHGVWTVGPDWVRSSAKAGARANEAEFECRGDVDSKAMGGPERGRTAETGASQALAAGLSFHLGGPWKAAFKEGVTSLIKVLGGTILKRPPLSTNIAGGRSVVVYEASGVPGSPAECRDAAARGAYACAMAAAAGEASLPIILPHTYIYEISATFQRIDPLEY